MMERVFRSPLGRTSANTRKLGILTAQKLAGGEETIHSATLFPYDIVEKVMEMDWRRS